jgi:hypothetical protein
MIQNLGWTIFFPTFFFPMKFAHFMFKIGEDLNIDDLGFTCCTLSVTMKWWEKIEVVEMWMKILMTLHATWIEFKFLNWIELNSNSPKFNSKCFWIPIK